MLKSLPSRAALRFGLVCTLLVLALLPGSSCRRSSTGGRAVAKLRLNEVMAANRSFSLTDASGRAVISDWVEIHNPTGGAVSLTGYSLTDNDNRPRKYELPAGTVLPPGGYLVVFLYDQERCERRCVEDCIADCGDDPGCAQECQADPAECARQCVPPVGLVAEINLGSTEDTLYLFGAGGRRLIDRVGVKNQRADISNGIDPRTGAYGVMYQPTPGAPNGPAGLKRPQVYSFKTQTTADGEPILIELRVDRDMKAQGPLDVEVEWADLSRCGESLAGKVLQPAAAVRRDTSGEDPTREDPARVDIEGNPVKNELLVTLTYQVELPPGSCGTARGVRILVADSVGEVSIEKCIPVCGETEVPTVLVNEYQPEHSSTEGVFFVRTDVDPPETGSEDWIEIWNYGSERADISRLGLLGGGELESFKSGGDFAVWTFAGNAGKSFLEPGELFCVVADRDRRMDSDPRKTYRLRDSSVGDTTRTFFSTRFRLSPDCPNAAGETFDTFALIHVDTGAILDEVLLDFSPGCDMQPGESVARFEAPEGTTPHVLKPGTRTDFPTFEKPNSVSGDVPPSFRDDVALETEGSVRCPLPGAPVIVHAQLNADKDRLAGEVEVEMFLELDPPVDGVKADLILTVAPNQTNRAVGATLYDVTATIPGLPAGTFVVFSYRAKDLVSGAEAVYHDKDEDVPGRSRTESLRYLVGFERAQDAPRINEVMPGSDKDTRYPEPYSAVQEDFAEIFNPSTSILDLEGYYLTTTAYPDAGESDPLISHARRFRFPAGTLVQPGGFLPVFFGLSPAVAPPGSAAVEDFRLDCTFGEILYLIAPDSKEAGANCVVDSMRWRLTQTVRVDGQDVTECKWNTAQGRLVDGCAPPEDPPCIVELKRPTPGEPNVSVLQPTLFSDAFHQPISIEQPPPPAGACVAPTTIQVLINAVFFVDETLEAVFEKQVVSESTFFADRGRGQGEETIQLKKPSDPFPDCPAAGDAVDCAFTPAGYGARTATLELNPPFGPIVRYRARIVDAMGRALEVGPFSFATTSSPHPSIVINELNKFAKASADPSSAERPWIELYNAGALEVDLSGMHLTNLAANLHKARIPDGTRLGPKSFRVIVTDGLEEPPLLHVPLDWNRRDQGSIFLVDAVERGECVIDSVAFDFTQFLPGESLGRDPDGSGRFVRLSEPSPGLPNGGRTVFVRGDANADGRVNITDMIRILAILFSGDGRRPVCEDALDSDDNGSINATDAVYIGNFVFRLGPPIPAPFPGAGVDPTPDAVTTCSD